MEKITFGQVLKTFRDYNKQHNVEYGTRTDVPEISAVIVYKTNNWSKPYTEEQRSYRITNRSGKFFFNGMCGNSIYGDCLDGIDVGVRLDAYNWEKEYCYFE